MDYPSSFDISAFPAGRRIALSRVMSIGAMIAFFVIVCLCGLILWSVHSRRLEPFMIAVDADTGVWSMVGRGAWTIDYSVERTMQESVVGRFMENWLTIAEDADENIAAWGKCSRDDCNSGDGLLYGTRRCAIYCHSGDDIFNRFTYNVVNHYTTRAASGETWIPNTTTMQITPIDRITDTGGTWRVWATVESNQNGPFRVEAFVKLARNIENYPAGMGFYITDFNAYRID